MKLSGRAILPAAILSGVVALLLIAGASAQSLSPSLLFTFPCNGSLACPDGFFPTSLIESPDGNFYGTAVGGGVGFNAQGTVFRMTPSGHVSVIYSFAEEPNGVLPYGSAPNSLVEGIDGFLYGVATFNGPLGLGTAFKLSKSGTIQDLHDFCAGFECNDGAYPAFITQALDGNFYGATGPSSPPANVLFRISPTGTFKVVHVFEAPKTQLDGSGAFGLLQAPDGTFYSTTVAGEQNSPVQYRFPFHTHERRIQNLARLQLLRLCRQQSGSDCEWRAVWPPGQQPVVRDQYSGHLSGAWPALHHTIFGRRDSPGI